MEHNSLAGKLSGVFIVSALAMTAVLPEQAMANGAITSLNIIQQIQRDQQRQREAARQQEEMRKRDAERREAEARAEAERQKRLSSPEEGVRQPRSSHKRNRQPAQP